VVEVNLGKPFAYTPQALSATDAEGLRSEVDEYAQASGLSVLSAGAPDEIRIWETWANFDPATIGYDTRGYILSVSAARICKISYAQRQHTPFRGSCAIREGMLHPVAEQQLAKLAKYANTRMSRGIVDGAWYEIDAAHAGKRFVISSSNPDSCEDDGSRAVSKLLSALVESRQADAQPRGPDLENDK
jgi:hypothetical protein